MGVINRNKQVYKKRLVTCWMDRASRKGFVNSEVTRRCAQLVQVAHLLPLFTCKWCLEPLLQKHVKEKRTYVELDNDQRVELDSVLFLCRMQ